MGNVIGLVPVPGDKPLGEFIKTLIERNREFADQKLEELEKTVEETIENDQPIEFAYAKLLNYLSKCMDQHELIALAADGLWHIWELDQ